jgi:hypothetical protein
LLALAGARHFVHVSRLRVKGLNLGKLNNRLINTQLHMIKLILIIGTEKTELCEKAMRKWRDGKMMLLLLRRTLKDIMALCAFGKRRHPRSAGE